MPFPIRAIQVDCGSEFIGALIRGADFSDTLWLHVTCPDGSNSDANGGTCVL
jgi:hypothetical protein